MKNLVSTVFLPANICHAQVTPVGGGSWRGEGSFFFIREKPEVVESSALQKYKWPGFDSCRRFKADYFKNRWNLKPQPSDYSPSMYLT